MGEPLDQQGQSQFVKYQRLERFEDSLANLMMPPPKDLRGSLKIIKYFLRYPLEIETRSSNTRQYRPIRSAF